MVVKDEGSNHEAGTISNKVVVVKDEDSNHEAGSLNLNLGDQVHPIRDEDAKGVKRTMIIRTDSNHVATVNWRIVRLISTMSRIITNGKKLN